MGIGGLVTAKLLEGEDHHHGSHEETKHATAEHKDEHKNEHKDEHKNEHKNEHKDEHEDGHLAIEILSIASGLLLVFGHVGNLILIRRRREQVFTADHA